jgi:hypothetical protein
MMLFRPTADQNLAAVHAALDAWNVEADRFRRCAIAARQGEAPSSLTISAAEEAHDGLRSLLDELDQAFDALPPGHPDFGAMLQAQTTALALLESIGNSYEVLERSVTEQIEAPTRIAHELRIAAE